jgi:hypothetical protein
VRIARSALASLGLPIARAGEGSLDISLRLSVASAGRIYGTGGCRKGTVAQFRNQRVSLPISKRECDCGCPNPPEAATPRCRNAGLDSGVGRQLLLANVGTLGVVGAVALIDRAGAGSSPRVSSPMDELGYYAEGSAPFPSQRLRKCRAIPPISGTSTSPNVCDPHTRTTPESTGPAASRTDENQRCCVDGGTNAPRRESGSLRRR